MPYIVYEHHGTPVVVREDLKGKHREHCLCWNCELFHPENPMSINCIAADELYQLCIRYSLVTPVWECPAFEKSDANLTQI